MKGVNSYTHVNQFSPAIWLVVPSQGLPTTYIVVFFC